MHTTISRSRPKCGRKPLREIHVSGKNVPATDAPSKPGKNSTVSCRGSPKGEGTMRRDGRGGDGDGVLDKLLLVRSDLAGLVREIDELVAQAFQLETTGRCGKEETDALSVFLSEILSSLKPWSSRLKSALSRPPISLEPAEPSSAIAVRSPEQDKFDSLISPSPLVSWRAECTIERGRQVFMLTPLPMSSKYRKPPPPDFPKPVSSAVPPLSLTLLEEGNDHETASKDEPPPMGEEQNFASPKLALRKPCSMVVVTPCFKLSPPRSCKLLDPSLDSSCWKDARNRKATPFPIGLRKYDNSLSESEEEGASEELTQKYPKLLAIRRDINKGNRAKEPSPEWSFSPPKTCVVMEPPAEKSPHDASDSFRLMPVQCDNSRLIEKTPVWRGPEGNRPRRPPGENTLKRELWTKFEAASAYNILKGNGSHSADSKLRGFMDRLDEASLDE
ncbi:hypothetical protein MLD38_028914 [Melastoma candidum]|uniref:Uncharacterized protein n=1 Tax=Melastoma candidum TaxID=119954 RepID=A0ACB9N398_9MYRT|nr:hypothetical protein MLD38_028914 [Melastoma candidum]